MFKNTLEHINRDLFTFIIFQITLSSFLFAQSPYELKTTRESILLGSGILGAGTSIALINNIDPLTVEELQTLSRENVNSIDRGATYNWSAKDWQISNYFLIANTLSPLLLFTSEKTHKDFDVISVMYLEVLLLDYAIPHLTKGLMQRSRPLVYSDRAPIEEKLSKDSQLSFFSAHATFSFSSAIFLSTMYGRYFPDSDLKPYVWGITLLSASVTSYLRYSSGAHFPTDIVTGAIVGAAIGYIIPKIHEADPESSTNIPETILFQKLFELRFTF